MKSDLLPFLELAAQLTDGPTLPQLEDRLRGVFDELNAHLPYTEFAPLDVLGSAPDNRAKNGEPASRTNGKRQAPQFMTPPAHLKNATTPAALKNFSAERMQNASPVSGSPAPSKTPQPVFSFRGRGQTPAASSGHSQLQERELHKPLPATLEQTARIAGDTSAPASKPAMGKLTTSPEPQRHAANKQAPQQETNLLAETRTRSTSLPPSETRTAPADTLRRETPVSGIAGIQQIMEELHGSLPQDLHDRGQSGIAQRLPGLDTAAAARSVLEMAARTTAPADTAERAPDSPPESSPLADMNPAMQTISTLADSLMHTPPAQSPGLPFNGPAQPVPSPAGRPRASGNPGSIQALNTLQERVAASQTANGPLGSTTAPVPEIQNPVFTNPAASGTMPIRNMAAMLPNNPGTPTAPAPAAISAEDLAALVNDALVRQARRNGIDL